MSLLPRTEQPSEGAGLAHGFAATLRPPAFDGAGRLARPGGALAASAGQALVAVIEHVAALIVLAELLILLSGVISRYVFGRPLTWTDDVASLLFVWLSMLGAVVALARNQHLRLTIVEKYLPTGANAMRHLVTQWLSLLFLGALFYHSFAHFADAAGAGWSPGPG